MKYNIINDSNNSITLEQKEEYKELIEGLKSSIKVAKRDVKIYEKSNHPRKLKEAKNHLSRLEKFLIEYETKYKLPIKELRESEIEESIIDLSKYDVKLKYTFDNGRKLYNIEGYGSMMDLRHYEVLLFMASKGGKIHAMDIDKIAQRFREVKTSQEQGYIWSPLLKKGYVEIISQKPLPSQLPFLFKSKKGEYIAKAGAGMELNLYSTYIYQLTQKGYDRVENILVDFERK